MLNQTLSRAIAEYRKKIFNNPFTCNYEIIVIIGQGVFNQLIAETDNRVIVCNNYPRYPLEGAEYFFEGHQMFFVPDDNTLAVAMRHKYTGEVIKRKNIKG
jgi:hypothetical protein